MLIISSPKSFRAEEWATGGGRDMRKGLKADRMANEQSNLLLLSSKQSAQLALAA
jgi:hypothetical protein